MKRMKRMKRTQLFGRQNNRYIPMLTKGLPICWLLVISMVLSACAVHEVPKENERYIEETGDEDSENAREEPKTEAVPEEQETDESITEEAKGQIPEDAKEYLEYLFDYLHPDRERIVDIELYETESRLCYKWKIEFKSGGISAPYVLAYYSSTQDGLYHLYAIYDEIWDTHYDENGETYKEHTRDSYLNFWIVNGETKELIPRSIFNKESEEEYIIWNERYLDMLDLYSEESE